MKTGAGASTHRAPVRNSPTHTKEKKLMRSSSHIHCSKQRLRSVAALEEPTTAIIYRMPERLDDATAVLANLEARGVAYAAPVDLQRQLWALGGAHARLSHRIALGGAR